MDEFEIDVQGKENNEVHNAQLPLNFLTFGEIEHDDVKVYIKQDVYKALEKYALADTAHERGTILLGDYSTELGKTHVVISNFIEARYTDASASTLTFTHETWDYVNKEHDTKYGDTKIVGWQHTHPSYGIFLSNYDLFIQENFFNLPFQIAYVIDPIQNIRGFFQWKNGKIEKLKGYYIYDEVGIPIKISQSKDAGVPSSNSKPAKSNGLWIGTSILSLIVAIVCLFMMSAMRRTIKNEMASLEYVDRISDVNKQEIDTIKSEIENVTDPAAQEKASENAAKINEINQTIDEMGKEIEKRKEANELQQRTIDEQQTIIDNQKAVIEEQAKRIDDLQVEIDNVIENMPEQQFIVHVVKKGESLSSICKKYGIDYAGNINVIKQLNGISNVNIVYVGQTIILPNVVS